MPQSLNPAAAEVLREVSGIQVEMADPGPYRELLEPIAGGAGIDLTHEDEYAAIQDQIGKHGNIDDALVLSNGASLLRDRGKDVRVAVFMAYSSLHVDGIATAPHTLALIHALIDRFGDELHPRRPAARRAALEWLCSERFIDRLTTLASAAPSAMLSTLQHALSGLAAIVQAWPDASRPDLSGLTQRVQLWLDQSANRVLGDAASPEATESTPSPTLGARSPLEQNINPKSSKEAWQLVRKASSVLRADPIWTLQGMALMCVSRWSAVMEGPPHEGGVTRLTGPRPEARAYVEGLLKKALWPLLLEECARVFNEASNHLWLDLVFWIERACEQVGSDLARARLSVDVRELLFRVPQLPTLKFADGTPFADAATQEWLQVQLNPAADTAPAPQPQLSVESQELQMAARAELKSKGILVALALVQQTLLTLTAQRERFELQRLMRGLAEEGGRVDLALGLARDLCAQVEEFGLARWEPSAAFDAWAALHRLLRAAGEASHSEARNAYRRLCGLDAVRAVSLLA